MVCFWLCEFKKTQKNAIKYKKIVKFLVNEAFKNIKNAKNKFLTWKTTVSRQLTFKNFFFFIFESCSIRSTKNLIA